MGQSRPLFVYFRSFLVTISIQIEKSIDDVLGIRTRGRRMVGVDETTELWRPPNAGYFYVGKQNIFDKQKKIYGKNILLFWPGVKPSTRFKSGFCALRSVSSRGQFIGKKIFAVLAGSQTLVKFKVF